MALSPRLVQHAMLLLGVPCGVWPTLAQVPDSARRRPAVTVITSSVNQVPAPADTPLIHHVAPRSPLMRELNTKALLLPSDTIFVASQEGAGEPIDTSVYRLFGTFYSELTFFPTEPELFAVYRMPLERYHIAYVLRVPGMYEPSAFDVWVYDEQRKRFSAPRRLAEAWGDAGAHYALYGWIVPASRGTTAHLVVRQQTSYVNLKTDSLDSQSDSLWVIPWTQAGFGTPVLRTDSLFRGLFDPRTWTLNH
jgi:hypothetical protein